jgi:cytochrome c oxidase assembly protein subunit 15
MTSFLKADRSRPVAVWLFVVAALVVAMVVVGGLTRLTDSGLSITQWKPLSGVIPPLSDLAWAKEFDLYKRIPQFSQMNPDMTLVGFKYIYWWEWTHRFLARVMGTVFIVAMVWFLVRREIPRRLIWRCFGLLLLFALQAVVGWWMVSSGLENRISVAPERLAAHLGLALIFYGCLIWCGLEAENGVGRVGAGGPWSRGGLYLTVLVFLQILLGAFVAGNHAGKIDNDWPLMNGHFVPTDYRGSSLWDTLAHNQASVQFDHRMMGYFVLLMILAFAWTSRSSRLVQPPVRAGAYLLAFVGLTQAALGIVTVLLVDPLWMGLIHQLVAVLLLTCAVWVTWRARRI